MDLKNKKIVIFDLDGTLTLSKAPLDAEMGELLSSLLKNKLVAVISGCNYEQFQKQFINFLPKGANLKNLFILPTSGARLYVWDNLWIEKYSVNFSSEEKKRVIEALETTLDEINYKKPNFDYGSLIEDRGSQITFSALGQNAPLNIKREWDPSHAKRKQMIDMLKQKLPNFDLQIGGSTSIDITPKGVNKSYGVKKIQKLTGISIADMVFIGNALFEGGNDYVVKATGVECIEVLNSEETKKILSTI